MNGIARFAVRYPVTVLMLVLGVILLGFISFKRLGTDLFPNLNTPRIYIELKAGEKPPEEIEKNYVDQIESLAMRQGSVISVSSSTRAGSATITVEYDWNKDMDEAFLDLQKELNSFAQNSDLTDFTISQYDPNASPVMTVALKKPGVTNMDELRKVADNYIRNELVRIEGVADVKLTGSEEGEVVIKTDKYILDAYGLTADAISTQIANYNRNVSGGSIVDMGLKYSVKGVSVLKEIKDLEEIIVGFRQPSGITGTSTSQASAQETNSKRVPVHLRDVATVSFLNKDPENIVTINGERCIGLSVYKEPKFNTVDVVKSLGIAFETLSGALPGYEFIRIQDQGTYIKSAISEVQNTALVGVLLAVFVIYIFLRRIGTTLIISIAIPVSIIATFNLMYFNHLTINIMTLGGLALGAGMLVDNAIVVLENITRNMEEGKPFLDSVILGTGQVGGAIVASTVTTIVVFLPIVYLHGASGELFKDQALTVAFALVSSLAVAMLVIPMLVSVIFGKRDRTRGFSGSIKMNWYSGFLSSVLERRGLVAISAVIVILLTALLVPKLGSEFMPKAESDNFTVNLKLPEGTSLERTASTVTGAESIIRSITGENLETIYSQAGTLNTSSLSQQSIKGENTAEIKVILKEIKKGDIDRTIKLIEYQLGEVDGLETTFLREETSLQSSLGTGESPFVVEVSGTDFDELERITGEVKKILQSETGLYNITNSIDEGTPELEIKIDRFRASYFSVTAENVISQIKSYLAGAEAGSFEKDGEMKDITVKLGRVAPSQLRDIMITAGSSKIPLSEIASVSVIKSPKEITRRNQSRTSYVYALVQNSVPLDKVVRETEAAMKTIVLPPDYKIGFAGEELKRKESSANLKFALILSLVLVFMVLAAQFESLVQPFIIMLTIPLAAAGTVLTFLIFGKSLNMMAYIGIIMLGGIAVNNAIIFIDRINQLREDGQNKKEAIVIAGSQRIRPILMTSLTTILGLLPLTIGFGDSAALRSPMAMAVIGGLVTSTLLTLIVIPCFYSLADSLTAKLRSKEETL